MNNDEKDFNGTIEWNEEFDEYLDDNLDSLSDKDEFAFTMMPEQKDVNADLIEEAECANGQKQLCVDNGREKNLEKAFLDQDSSRKSGHSELFSRSQEFAKPNRYGRKRSRSMDTATRFDSEYMSLQKCRSMDKLNRLSLAKPKLCGDSVEIQALLHRAHFFRIALSESEIAIAREKCVCLVTAYMESLLCEALQITDVVVLMFMLQKDTLFGGFAVLTGDLKEKHLNRDERDTRLRSVQMKWISRSSFPSASVRSDESWYVDSSKYEFRTDMGQKICSVFPYDGEVDLSNFRTFLRKEKKSSRKRNKSDEGSKKSLPSLLDLKLPYNQQFKRPRSDIARLDKFPPHSFRDFPCERYRNPVPLFDLPFPERFDRPRFNDDFHSRSPNSPHFHPYPQRRRFDNDMDSYNWRRMKSNSRRRPRGKTSSYR